jgi:hypothetical protein
MQLDDSFAYYGDSSGFFVVVPRVDLVVGATTAPSRRARPFLNQRRRGNVGRWAL